MPRRDSCSRIVWNYCFEMALSEFEVIVGGLTSIPVLAGIFFLIEKTYGSKNYLRKPVKASPASKAAAPKAATSKAATSKQKDGAAVQSASTKNISAKPKTSVAVKKNAAPTAPSKSAEVESSQSKVSTPAKKKNRELYIQIL